jgi:hypothetical protein
MCLLIVQFVSAFVRAIPLPAGAALPSRQRVADRLTADVTLRVPAWSRHTASPCAPWSADGASRQGSVSRCRARCPRAVCKVAGNAAWHFGQAVSLASNTRSGFGCSVRPNPRRPLRGGFFPMGRSGFWPFDGGSEELSGVLAGHSNLARRFSSSPIRASAASNRSTSDRMSSSFPAWLSVLRSISCVTQSLNRAARDRVNRHWAAAPATPAEQLRCKG